MAKVLLEQIIRSTVANLWFACYLAGWLTFVMKIISVGGQFAQHKLNFKNTFFSRNFLFLWHRPIILQLQRKYHSYDYNSNWRGKRNECSVIIVILFYFFFVCMIFY